MRNRTLVLFAATIIFASLSVGCANKRKTSENLQAPSLRQNPYWQGCESSCDAIDDSSHQLGAAEDSLATSSDDKMRFFGSDGTLNESSSLTCQSCGKSQNRLIEGLCLDCTTQNAIGNSTQRNSKNLRQHTDLGYREFTNKLQQNLSESNYAKSSRLRHNSNRQNASNAPGSKDVAQPKRDSVFLNKETLVQSDQKQSIESIRDPFESPLPDFIADEAEFGFDSRKPAQANLGIDESASSDEDYLGSKSSTELEPQQASTREESKSFVGRLPEPAEIQKKLAEIVSEPIPKQESDSLDTESSSPIDSDGGTNVPDADRFESATEGGISASADPQFETFRLQDLFSQGQLALPKEFRKPKRYERDDIEWGPPQEVKPERKKSDVQPRGESIQPKPAVESQIPKKEDYTEQRAPRNEQSIVNHLKNSTVPSKIIYDNTPQIAEQQYRKPDLVLRARPVDFYHDLLRERVANRDQQLQSETMEMAADDVSEIRETRNSLRAIPVGNVKSHSDSRKADSVIPNRSSIEFHPLPELKGVLETSEIKSANIIDDRVYQPYDFPEQPKTQKQSKPGELFEEILKSLAPGEFDINDKTTSADHAATPADNRIEAVECSDSVVASSSKNQDSTIKSLPPVDDENTYILLRANTRAKSSKPKTRSALNPTTARIKF